MSTSHSGIMVLLLMAGLGMVLVLVGLFSYGSRYLGVVAEAEQYLADQRPIVSPAVASELGDEELGVGDLVLDPDKQNLAATSTDSEEVEADSE